MNSSMPAIPVFAPDYPRLLSSSPVADISVLTVIPNLHRTTESAFASLASVFVEIDHMQKNAAAAIAASTTSVYRELSGILEMAPPLDVIRLPCLRKPAGPDRLPATAEEEAISDRTIGRQDGFRFSATFDVRVPSRPLNRQVSSPQNSSLQMMPNAVLTDTEQTLRTFVEEHLRSMHGHRWFVQCVPTPILKGWVSREKQDRQGGSSGYPLIAYANFMDLLSVITEEENWNSTFEPIFGGREEISVSFRRLRRIRNHIAHSRNLNQEDQLTLVAEAHWILGRLGRAILS